MNQDSFKNKPHVGADIGSEHELFLVKHTGRPTFIIDWPAKIKPFYMRRKDDNSNLVSCSYSSSKLIRQELVSFICRSHVLIYSSLMLVNFVEEVYEKIATKYSETNLKRLVY